MTTGRKLVWAFMLIILTSVYLIYTARRDRRDLFPPRIVMEMRSIETAISSYRATSGQLPYTEHPSAIEQNNASLMAILTDTNRVQGPFMTPRISGALLDPWGHAYHIYFATNAEAYVVVGQSTVKESIAVWSDGSNGVNEYGEGDDFASWKRVK